MAAPDPSTTELRLSGYGVPDYSARGLHEELTPISQAFRILRTINGQPKNFAATQFQKYKISITGDDQEAPALDGIWQSGKILVTIDCLSELGFLTGVGSPEKPVVPNSERTELSWTWYRPRLAAIVTGFSISRDEYGRQIAWKLEAEEV